MHSFTLSESPPVRPTPAQHTATVKHHLIRTVWEARAAYEREALVVLAIVVALLLLLPVVFTQLLPCLKTATEDIAYWWGVTSLAVCI